MGKANEILERMGGALMGSAGHRPPPVAMPGASVSLAPAGARMADLIRSKTAYDIPVARIEADPDQPRKTFDDEEQAQLADSIRHNGLLHPIGVRWIEGEETYRVIYGERRLRAARDLGWASVSCKVWPDGLTPEQVTTIQSCENLSRASVRPIEQARAFRSLLTVNNLTQVELARQLGVSQGAIAQALQLLEAPEPVQEMVAGGQLAASVAYAISSKIEDPAEQVETAARIVGEGLNRGEAAEVVRQVASRPRAGGTKPAAKGKAKPKAKPVTSRVIRAENGYKVTVERARGIEPAALLAALEEAAARVRVEVEGQGAEAA